MLWTLQSCLPPPPHTHTHFKMLLYLQSSHQISDSIEGHIFQQKGSKAAHAECIENYLLMTNGTFFLGGGGGRGGGLGGVGVYVGLTLTFCSH